VIRRRISGERQGFECWPCVTAGQEKVPAPLPETFVERTPDLPIAHSREAVTKGFSATSSNSPRARRPVVVTHSIPDQARSFGHRLAGNAMARIGPGAGDVNRTSAGVAGQRSGESVIERRADILPQPCVWVNVSRLLRIRNPNQNERQLGAPEFLFDCGSIGPRRGNQVRCPATPESVLMRGSSV
jgi:hypothetical protein